MKFEFFVIVRFIRRILLIRSSDSMLEILELGKVSSRGQIAIPADIRREMGLEDGSKVIFFLEDDTLLIKKVHSQTWVQITEPLKQAKKKIKQNEVDKLIHKIRRT